MQIGLALPQYDYAVPAGQRLEWPTVVDWARRAEALGFDALFLADHLFLSVEKYGGPPDPHFGYDPIVALSGLARATRRIALGTLVICAQLRPPHFLAKQLETLAALAPRRLIAGFGAGWYEPEYEAAGVAFESPGVRLRQVADTLDVAKPFLEPAGVPRWVGGKGDRLLDVVAQHADGWNTVWAWTPDDYAERVEVLDAACRRVRRDPATVTRSVGLYTLVGADEADLAARFERMRAATPLGVLDGVTLDQWRRGHLVGTVDEVRAQVERWEHLGVAMLIVGLGAVPFALAASDDLDLAASALV